VVEDLYTVSDTKRIRELLLQQQQGLDALTNLEIPQGKAVLDHLHDDEQLVRGVLHRSINVAVGRLENSFTRDLKWWYPYDLPTFLEQAAVYLRKQPHPYRHLQWQKKLKVLFNQLSAKQMKFVLESFNKSDGRNAVERKKIFQEIVLQRDLGFDTIRSVITKAKETV
jgi:hypothetical protein